jgi:phytoene dehydrogenase-like protein
VALYQSLNQTADALPGRDGAIYKQLMQPLVENWDSIADFALGPFRIPGDIPAAIQFGMRSVLPATWLAKIFQNDDAKALLAGLAAHSIMPLDMSPSAAFGLVLGALGHVVGWPMPKGGSQSVADALVAYLQDLGGEVICDAPVDLLDALPSARAYLFDTAPEHMIQIAGHRLPDGLYTKQVEHYRYGPGVFKVDWALSERIPWKNELCKRAGTLHLGGTIEEITRSERLMWEGIHSDNPYMIVAQQSVFDDTRAPDGQHTGWAYCHVPQGSTRDMTEVLIGQIERFAPGFRDCILETATMHSLDYQRYNPNYIGGDINGGIADWGQLFTRPVVRTRPYTTPAEGVYLCSSSTPPGGGVHGMCGYHAARAVLWDNRGL